MIVYPSEITLTLAVVAIRLLWAFMNHNFIAEVFVLQLIKGIMHYRRKVQETVATHSQVICIDETSGRPLL